MKKNCIELFNKKKSKANQTTHHCDSSYEKTPPSVSRRADSLSMKGSLLLVIAALQNKLLSIKYLIKKREEKKQLRRKPYIFVDRRQ